MKKSISKLSLKTDKIIPLSNIQKMQIVGGEIPTRPNSSKYRCGTGTC